MWSFWNAFSRFSFLEHSLSPFQIFGFTLFYILIVNSLSKCRSLWRGFPSRYGEGRKRSRDFNQSRDRDGVYSLLLLFPNQWKASGRFLSFFFFFFCWIYFGLVIFWEALILIALRSHALIQSTHVLAHSTWHRVQKWNSWWAKGLLFHVLDSFNHEL